MEIRTGFPFRGKALEELRAFLERNGLAYDEGVRFSVCLVEDEKIAATGSLDGKVLKCIAVSPEFQEGGLAARIVTELAGEAARNGVFHLFIFTKPGNEFLFRKLGFYTIAKTGDVLLMENKKNGIASFVSSLGQPAGTEAAASPAGAIVMNCNPFTRGHRYLVESAAKQCALLRVFVVSENRSAFPAGDRYRLVCEGTAHIKNVLVHPTGPYLVSSATFPDYFLKEAFYGNPGAAPLSPRSINTLLDLSIFAECFAKPLGISRRFVGTEPFDPVTAEYNRQMKEALPRFGIEVIELDRLEEEGEAISASRVRRLLQEGKLEQTRALVPETTYDYLVKNRGGPLDERR
ncbi:MAG: [citrate (pro-3S)-lyase] ligase [Treponema sp.]|jgi:[citrate (pro-3S)-lyase] ligase|nr:[citrate (pro-3S)-lyase] ligase [Treponema sp.]